MRVEGKPLEANTASSSLRRASASQARRML